MFRQLLPASVKMWIYNFHESGGYRKAKSSNPFYMEFNETQWHWYRFCPRQYHPTSATCSFTYHQFHVNFRDDDVIKIQNFALSNSLFHTKTNPSNASIYINVSQNIFFANYFWFRQITTDPHINAQ